MKDLSDMPLLKTSLATDSMLATNQIFESNGMKAPGGASGDLPDRGEINATVHSAPVIEMIDNTVPVGGPKETSLPAYTPSALEWKKTVDG